MIILDTWKIAILIAVMFVFSSIKSIFQQKGRTKSYQTAVLSQSTIFAIVFEKLSTIDLRAMSKVNAGELSNNLTNDVLRVLIALVTGHQIILSPTLLVIYFIILILNIKVYALAGLGIVVLALIFIIVQGNIIAKLTRKKLKYTSQRNKEINFCMSGIKTVKFNAWEGISKEIIQKIRSHERSIIIKIQVLQSFMDVITFLLPSLAGFVCIVLYNKSNTIPLAIGDVFFVITVFNLLTGPLKIFFIGFMNMQQAKVALKRISRLMIMPDGRTDLEDPDVESLEKGSVIFRNASFSFADKNYDREINDLYKIIGENPNAIEQKRIMKLSPKARKTYGRKYIKNIFCVINLFY